MSDAYGDSYYYAGGAPARGGGGAPAPSRPSTPPAPSGGGGGGISHIAGGGGPGPAVRAQKTEVNSHAQQAAIGGPGAPNPQPRGGMQPHPGLPGGMGPDHMPGIGEHRGIDGREGNRAPSQRDERGHPDQFRNFDQRFDHDRDRLGNNYWRTAFSDYDLDRFRPYLAEDPYLYQIFGVNYYPEYVQMAVPWYPTTCGPFNEGIFVIGADSRWYPVHRHQMDIIDRVERVRGIRAYRPVIIPNCGVGYPTLL